MFYCDSTCQAAHWAGLHKPLCVKNAALEFVPPPGAGTSAARRNLGSPHALVQLPATDPALDASVALRRVAAPHFIDNTRFQAHPAFKLGELLMGGDGDGAAARNRRGKAENTRIQQLLQEGAQPFASYWVYANAGLAERARRAFAEWRALPVPTFAALSAALWDTVRDQPQLIVEPWAHFAALTGDAALLDLFVAQGPSHVEEGGEAQPCVTSLSLAAWGLDWCRPRNRPPPHSFFVTSLLSELLDGVEEVGGSSLQKALALGCDPLCVRIYDAEDGAAVVDDWFGQLFARSSTPWPDAHKAAIAAMWTMRSSPLTAAATAAAVAAATTASNMTDRKGYRILHRALQLAQHSPTHAKALILAITSARTVGACYIATAPSAPLRPIDVVAAMASDAPPDAVQDMLECLLGLGEDFRPVPVPMVRTDEHGVSTDDYSDYMHVAAEALLKGGRGLLQGPALVLHFAVTEGGVPLDMRLTSGETVRELLTATGHPVCMELAQVAAL